MGLIAEMVDSATMYKNSNLGPHPTSNGSEISGLGPASCFISEMETLKAKKEGQ